MLHKPITSSRGTETNETWCPHDQGNQRSFPSDLTLFAIKKKISQVHDELNKENTIKCIQRKKNTTNIGTYWQNNLQMAIKGLNCKRSQVHRSVCFRRNKTSPIS